MYILTDQNLGQTATPPTASSFNPVSWVQQGVQEALTAGKDLAATLQLLQAAMAKGITDENELTDLVFLSRHPGRKSAKLVPGEPQFEALRQQWLMIRAQIVRPMLKNHSKPVSIPVPANLPQGDSAKVPKGFKEVFRKGVSRGLSRYGGERLDRMLIALRKEGRITITDEDIDTLQRIANVETGGLIQALNTWDSAVVSIGFMQWTLQHGKLQQWIEQAPAAFQRYGIAVDQSRSYIWTVSKGKENRQSAIVGAATKQELRWNGWAERFYLAGLDPEIVIAEVPLALWWLQKHLSGLKAYLKRNRMPDDFATFATHYSRSLQIRGIFQAAYNNLPAAALNGARNALLIAKKEGSVSTKRFLEIFQQAILDAYIARNDNGSRIISETRRGAEFK